MRAITKRTFNLWLGKGRNYYQELKDGENSTDFSDAQSYISNFIESEQLQAGLAGLISSQTVNSLLALINKTEHSGAIDIKQITGMNVI